MGEYSIFTRDFDPRLYLIRPFDLRSDFEFNKESIFFNNSQIPSKFKKNIRFPHNVDHAYLNCLNCLNDLTAKEYIYLYKSDYLELILFLMREDILKYGIKYGIKYGVPKISHYDIDNLQILKNDIDNLQILDRYVNDAILQKLNRYVNDAILKFFYRYVTNKYVNDGYINDAILQKLDRYVNDKYVKDKYVNDAILEFFYRYVTDKYVNDAILKKLDRYVNDSILEIFYRYAYHRYVNDGYLNCDISDIFYRYVYIAIRWQDDVSLKLLFNSWEFIYIFNSSQFDKLLVYIFVQSKNLSNVNDIKNPSKLKYPSILKLIHKIFYYPNQDIRDSSYDLKSKYYKILDLLIDHYTKKNPDKILITDNEWFLFINDATSLEFYLSHTNTPFRTNSKFPYKIPDESLAKLLVHFNPEFKSIFLTVYGKEPENVKTDYVSADVY